MAASDYWNAFKSGASNLAAAYDNKVKENQKKEYQKRLLLDQQYGTNLAKGMYQGDYNLRKFVRDASPVGAAINMGSALEEGNYKTAGLNAALLAAEALPVGKLVGPLAKRVYNAATDPDYRSIGDILGNPVSMPARDLSSAAAPLSKPYNYYVHYSKYPGMMNKRKYIYGNRNTSQHLDQAMHQKLLPEEKIQRYQMLEYLDNLKAINPNDPLVKMQPADAFRELAKRGPLNPAFDSAFVTGIEHAKNLAKYKVISPDKKYINVFKTDTTYPGQTMAGENLDTPVTEYLYPKIDMYDTEIDVAPIIKEYKQLKHNQLGGKEVDVRDPDFLDFLDNKIRRN